MDKLFKIHVVNKETGKVVWTEEHKAPESINKAIRDLQRNNFNPQFFSFIREDE